MRPPATPPLVQLCETDGSIIFALDPLGIFARVSEPRALSARAIADSKVPDRNIQRAFCAVTGSVVSTAVFSIW